jgi:hypothetical protein
LASNDKDAVHSATQNTPLNAVHYSENQARAETKIRDEKSCQNAGKPQARPTLLGARKRNYKTKPNCLCNIKRLSFGAVGLTAHAIRCQEAVDPEKSRLLHPEGRPDLPVIPRSIGHSRRQATSAARRELSAAAGILI